MRASICMARKSGSRPVSQTAVLNALPARIALLDPAGVIMAVNENWRRFATINELETEDFAVGVNYLEVCEAAVGEGLGDVLAGRRPSFEIEYPCHSASERQWFRLMVGPLRPGQQEGIVVMHLNVTERRLAEEASYDRERRFRTMADVIPQLAWVARADGYIFWYNERLYEYTGTRAVDMEGWGWQSVHDPAVLPEVITRWTVAVASQRAFEMEFSPRAADATSGSSSPAPCR